MRCETCKWYEKTEIRQGECHRMPPAVVFGVNTIAGRQMGGVMSVYAPTKADGWCGEWDGKENASE